MNSGVGVRLETGTILAHREFMKHLIREKTHGFHLTYSYQTTGVKDWQVRYRLPKIEGDFYYTNFGNNEQLGRSFGGYASISLPFIRRQHFFIGPRIGTGLAFITKSFDQQTNPKNNVIAYPLNSLIVLGLEFEYQFQQSAVSFHAALTHFSNGATEMPNLGINLATLSVGYAHYFKPIEFNDVDRILNWDKKKWNYYLLGVGSVKEVYPTGGRKYPAASLSFLVQKQFFPKFGIDLSADLFYNSSLGAEEEMVKQTQLFQSGVYVGFFLPINRLELLTGVGAYLCDYFKTNGAVYNRFGLRYKLNEKWLINFTIKAHLGRADYIEYGIGYNLR